MDPDRHKKSNSEFSPKTEFKQSEILEIASSPLINVEIQATAAENGICQELCLKWLKRLREKAEKFPDAEQRMAGFWDAKTLKKAIERHNQCASDPRQSPLKLYGFTEPETFFYKPELLSQWLRKGGGIFLAFRCCDEKGNPSQSSHAIAAYIKPTDGCRLLNPIVLAFDPNLGEYSMKAGSFLSWLGWILGYYHSSDKHLIKSIYFKPARMY